VQVVLVGLRSELEVVGATALDCRLETPVELHRVECLGQLLFLEELGVVDLVGDLVGEGAV